MKYQFIMMLVIGFITGMIITLGCGSKAQTSSPSTSLTKVVVTVDCTIDGAGDVWGSGDQDGITIADERISLSDPPSITVMDTSSSLPSGVFRLFDNLPTLEEGRLRYTCPVGEQVKVIFIF